MADITRYPNPLRLFSQTRNEWLVDLIQSFDVPMHVFTVIRDSQLGQLMFAVESARQKRQRAGEDDTPDLLSEDNAIAFIQVFALIQQFRDLLEEEEIDLEDLKNIKSSDKMSEFMKVQKTNQEWFSTLPFDRLDEIYIAAAQILHEEVFSTLEDKIELEEDQTLMENLKDREGNLGNFLSDLINQQQFDAIENSDFDISEKEDKTVRIFTFDDEEKQLSYEEYHGQVNLLHDFILELNRLLTELDDYSYSIDGIKPLITTEMLIMYPSPNKDYINVIKDHLDIMKTRMDYPKSFWEILSISYQTFSHMEESSQRFLRKLFKSSEQSMKDTSRTFWKDALKLKEKDSETFHQLIAVLWAHFRASQSQAKQIEQQKQQSGQSSHSHSATVRMEHIFWVQARNYIEVDEFTSPFQFWSKYASIANKQVRSKEDSLKLFHELEEFISSSEILTNEEVQEKLIVNQADQYSLLQRLMSYGLEARTDEIHDEIDQYINTLEALLDNIDVDKMHEGFNLDQERKVIKNIRTHMENPEISKQT